MQDGAHSAFRAVPRTGVIYVTTEAARAGYRDGSTTWCNLGQGQPETGALAGAPERIEGLHIDPSAQDYAPVAGHADLRAAVADYYNRTYRRGCKSQYTAENVAISSGGRTALTRLAAALGQVNLGHFLPDYTAYEELLDVFRAFTAIPILLDPERGYRFTASDLRAEILGRGLSAVLVSNPANPTGRHVRGTELASWVEVARQERCALLVDEFYSRYLWTEAAPAESAARYVEDVDRDPLVVVDGLTKNWRYPGWRVAWTVGPRDVIEAVSSAGSFLDGGGSHPMQAAAVQLLESDWIERESAAMTEVFRPKRDYLLRALSEIGVRCDLPPEGTFYVWGDLSGLPEPLNDGLQFFRAALEHEVIVVPGRFFDVNPGGRRRREVTRFSGHVRFSFGPDMDVLERAAGKLKQMVSAARG